MLAFNPVTNEASLQKHVYQREKALRRPTHLVHELRLLPYEDRLRQLQLPFL
jgi:hypothetical protein